MSCKTKTTAINADDKPALTPKLRFPEFRDTAGWEETQLQKIARPVTDRAVTGDGDNVLSLSGEYGLVLQSDYFGKKVAGDSAERYIKLVRNDFVYNDRTTKASVYGTIKRLSKYDGGIVSPIYKCFRFDGGEAPEFWEWYFEAGAHESQLGSLVNEGARAGRFNISISQFLSTSAWHPKEPEQQKIAECLNSVDELIAAQARKLDALKTHKKGLMQQLFPREGETQPRLRFPEFQNAGEWEEVRLGNIASVLTDRAGTKQCTLMSVTSGVGLISQQEKFGRIIAGNQQKTYFLIGRDDFAYNKSRTKAYPQGYIARYTKDEPAAVPNSIFNCFRTNQAKVFPVFLEYLFASNIHGTWLKDHITVGARVHGSLNVSNDDLLCVPIPMPSGVATLAEQHHIADCLTSLDDLITAETQKLAALKTHKKGLMQQLFPYLAKE